MDGRFCVFKIVLSVPGQEVKCSKKAVRLLKNRQTKTKASPSLSYCLGLGQERLPKLYELQNKDTFNEYRKRRMIWKVSKIGKTTECATFNRKVSG